MVLSTSCHYDNAFLQQTFASRYINDPLPQYQMRKQSIPKDVAYQLVHDELMLDGNPRLDLSSFLTSWMEPECDKLIMDAISKNFIGMFEYPVTTELQTRCVSMIADLFKAPRNVDKDTAAVGVGTVGSSEAVTLAALAFKRKWQHKHKDQPYRKPNIVAGSNVQVCWEKFANYFDVELKKVDVKKGYYIMDPAKAVEMVDENTICVAAILGSTYNGEFEDIKTLNDLLKEKNSKTGWDTAIHVDAAIGGFVAPFLYPDLEWDFRLPLVKSINVSGHKYGLVYPGIGWVIWRGKEDLPEDLIIEIDYLGGKQPTFTLNFSKGASQTIAQYYQFIRLGFEGYERIIKNCHDNANFLYQSLVDTNEFVMVSKTEGVPLVGFSLKEKKWYDEYEISKRLRRFGWMVPAYAMPPKAKNIHLLRVVVRESFSRTLVKRLVDDIATVLKELDGSQSPGEDGPQSSGEDGHPNVYNC